MRLSVDACAALGPGPYPPDLEAAVIASLRGPDMRARAAALAAVGRWGIAQHAVQVDPLVDALRIAARIGPDIALAIELLASLGSRAAAAVFDVCRQLRATADPRGAAWAVVAIVGMGALPDAARRILEGHCADPRPEVAAAAASALAALR